MTIWVGFDGTLLDEDGDGPAAASGDPFATLGQEHLAGVYESEDGRVLVGQVAGVVHFYVPLGQGSYLDVLDDLRQAGWVCEITSETGLAANCTGRDGTRMRIVTDPDMTRVQLFSSPDPKAFWEGLDWTIARHVPSHRVGGGYAVGDVGDDLSSVMSQFGSAMGSTQQSGIGQQFGQLGGALGTAAGGTTGQQVGQSIGSILGSTMQGAQQGGWQGALAQGLAAVVKDAVVPAIAAAAKGSQKPPSSSQAMAQLAAPAAPAAPAPAPKPVVPAPVTPAVTYTPAASPSSVASSRTLLMQTLDGLAQKYGLPPASTGGGPPTLQQVASFAQTVAPS